ncbi:helix-turn-helix domain-containing protein [Hydrogeniiclostridium mannosilyticum]|uniref:helix-turn-helix domain-containing protein n=1 Tax=Hydrogeniiclostridium mannosilyticum TaxID=2764322 RepID=UPI0018AC794B|nr:helix-turn-helix transcriptional regulator [Hydrogeniiclostridium mannosilyticum]
MNNRIRELRKQHKMTMKELGAVVGLAESTISQYETGKRQPDNETLLKLGEYFNTSVDYLLGSTRTNENAPPLTQKDERDIEKRLQNTIEELESLQDGLTFSGEALDDESRELLAISLKNSLEIAKRAAKQKYTPKKYKK